MNKWLMILGVTIVIALAGLVAVACGGNGTVGYNPVTSADNSVPSGGNGSEAGSGGSAWGHAVSFAADDPSYAFGPVQITVGAPSESSGYIVPDGYKTVVCSVTYQNSAPAGEGGFSAYSPLSYFEMFDSAGQSYAADNSPVAPGGEMLPDPYPTVAAGQTVTVNLAFAIPTGQSPGYVQYTAMSHVTPHTATWGRSETPGRQSQGSWIEIILEATDSARAPRTAAAMEQATLILTDRVKALGLTAGTVTRQGDWQVVLRLPPFASPQGGDLNSALTAISRIGVLEFFDINTQFGTSYASEAEALKAAGVTSYSQLPSDKEVVHWPVSAESPSDAWYLVTTPPMVSGADLTSAQQAFDTFDNPKIDLQFSGDGAQKFSDMTQKMAQTAQATGQDQLLAIALDGVVESAPRVLEQIPGGQAEISGKFTLDEAKNLALLLQSGALPLNLVQILIAEIPAPK